MRVNVLIAILAAASAVGCGESGPPTTRTKSAALATLADRQAFLER